MKKNILFINPFGIGDVLFSTILVRELRKDNPNSYIAYICNLKVKEILVTNPDINEVFVFERDEYRDAWRRSMLIAIKKFLSFWREIKNRKFNIVFDLSIGKEYAFLCWWIGIKDRRGFDYKNRGRFLNHKIEFDGFNNKPVAEYYLDLLSVHQTEKSFHSVNGNTVLIITDEDRRCVENFLSQSGIKYNDMLIGIAPGGGMSFGPKNQDRRRWPVKRFAELADKVVEKFNAGIVLIWGPGEEGMVKDIMSLMKNKPLIAPATKIREMSALCKRCKLVICSEGGPLHIANSQGVNTVSIFGPVDEKVYGPYPLGENNIVITSNVDCRPCYKKFKLPDCDNKKCIDDISVEEIFEAVKRSFA